MAKRKKRKAAKRKRVTCRREKFRGGTRTVCRDTKGRIRKSPKRKRAKRKSRKR